MAGQAEVHPKTMRRGLRAFRKSRDFRSRSRPIGRVIAHTRRKRADDVRRRAREKKKVHGDYSKYELNLLLDVTQNV